MADDLIICPGLIAYKSSFGCLYRTRLYSPGDLPAKKKEAVILADIDIGRLIHFSPYHLFIFADPGAIFAFFELVLNSDK